MLKRFFIVSKHLTTLCLASTTALFLCSQAVRAETAKAIRAMDFVNGLGVNTHTIYTDSQYADTNQTIAAMKYLGLRLIRDVSPNPANAGQWTYATLAQAGLAMDLFSGGDAPGGTQDPATAVASMAALESAYPGSVHAIEGPNEVNNGPVSYAGVIGLTGARAYQAALYAQVRATPALASVPVYNFTDYPDATGQADYANFHTYPNTTMSCTAGGLTANMKSQLAVMPGKAIVNTEIGASTRPSLQPGALDQASQARFLLQCALDNAAAGVKETYFYQLFDAYADPAGVNSQDHYGLFDSAYAPKAAATTIRNTVAILQETAPGVDETTFAPGSLTYVVSGADTIKTKLMQMGSGWWVIGVWNDVPVYSAANGGAALHSRVSATLSLTRPHQEIRVHNAVTGGRYTVKNAATVTFDQTGDPIFLVVSPS